MSNEYDDEYDDEPIVRSLTTEEKVLADYAQGGIASSDLIHASGYSIDSSGNLRDNFGDIISSEYCHLYVEDERNDPTSVFYTL